MTNSVDPDQLASEEANCSDSLLFAKAGHIWAQQDQGSLQKHAYSNILKILPPKNENFQINKNLIFLIFLLKT